MIALADVAEHLLSWFQDHKRDLPFRWQGDPYKILIAGVLLRQTQALQVAAVYPRLIEIYDTPHLLALADEKDLKHILRPLGISSRARVLIEIAKAIVQKHDGVVPENYSDLIELPGIGDYIASCVLALGYKQSLPMVDVNVERVIGRLYGKECDIHQKYNEMCPRDQEEEFHYAVLDLAQKICRHINPKCDLCPLGDKCKYHLGRF